ncbi:MAG: hypothetical protein PHI97_00800 [Desulfobulbus sp.]|nr:hypothetical protein [Desulfobulbus sp.]
MFNLPKVKKTLTGLVSGKSIKKVVASVVLAAGLIVGGAALPANSTAAMSNLQYGAPVEQGSQIGALVLTSSSGELGRTAWHESHASHSSHASHASHYSSRY